MNSARKDLVFEDWVRPGPLPGYWVTRDGEVWSTKRGKLPAALKPQPDGRAGHLRVYMHHEGQLLRCYIHVLVAEVFLGPAPFPGAMVLHRDGVPTHNNVQNLVWGSQSLNERHKFACARGASWDWTAEIERVSLAEEAEATYFPDESFGF